VSRRQPQEDIPVCLVLLQLQRQEDGDERRHFVLAVAAVRLLRWCWVENGGRMRRVDEGEHVAVIPMRA